MSLYDDLPDRKPSQRIWSARIATEPTSFSERVSVVISGLDDTLRWEDCRWQARNQIDMPERGDECLVAFDDEMQVWVVAWWPFQ